MKITPHFYKVLFLGFSLASVLSILSWILSRRDILPTEATRRWAMDVPSVAKAGFPIQAFELPQPPLGSDVIPHEMLNGLLLNELFWIVVGLGLALLIYKRYPAIIQTCKGSILLIPGVIAVFLHLIPFALWFD